VISACDLVTHGYEVLTTRPKGWAPVSEAGRCRFESCRGRHSPGDRRPRLITTYPVQQVGYRRHGARYLLAGEVLKTFS
jgi:hypothetical protein